MDIYLSFNNGSETLQLPVLPSSYQITKGNNNQAVNINDFGEINIIGNRRLSGITLESFFPGKPYSFLRYSPVPAPYECVETIEKWMNSKKPIRLIITDTNINMAMAIEDFTYGEQDGSRDVYYSLGLKEYRFPNLEATTGIYATEDIEKPEAQEYDIPKLKDREFPMPSFSTGKTYICNEMDTLESVCIIAYGSYSAANAQKLIKLNPDSTTGEGVFKSLKIKAGTVIQLEG